MISRKERAGSDTDKGGRGIGEDKDGKEDLREQKRGKGLEEI